MSTPLALSDEEMDVLHQLAGPIAWNRRQEFIDQVVGALAACPEPGPGAVHCAAREVQRGFTLQAQKETAIAAAPRHLAARATAQV